MTSDPNLSRRVERLENDTESIYEIIAEIRSVQGEHTRRFDQLEGQVTRIDGKVTQLDGKVTGMQGVLDEVVVTLNEVVRRLPEPS